MQEEVDPPPAVEESCPPARCRVFHPPDWVKNDPTYNPEATDDPERRCAGPEQQENAEDTPPSSQAEGVGPTQLISITSTKPNNTTTKTSKRKASTVHSRFRKSSE